jgi:hypothetical protein
MAEKHPDVKFEYSFSDGKYWSPYNHCRVWENGTYDLMIRDNYGQTAKRVYEETSIIEDKEIPVRIEFIDFTDFNGNPIEYYDGVVVARSSGKMVITILGDFDDPRLYMKTKGQTAWQENGGFTNNKKTLIDPGQAEYYIADSYGRKSKIFTSEVVTYTPYSPRPAITILHADSGVLITEVRDDTETNAVPRRYAISYDDGKTWSNWQLGRYFQKLKPSTGTYWIRVKIKYTTGVESNSVGKMVTIK